MREWVLSEAAASKPRKVNVQDGEYTQRSSDQYDSDHPYGLADFAQVNECSYNEDKCQYQQHYPNGSRCRGVELVCGNEVGLHILEFDGSSVAFLGFLSGRKHMK
jgi:hypothetical protein